MCVSVFVCVHHSVAAPPSVSVVCRLPVTCRYRVWRAGNRHTDVTSYQAVEIPDSRIMIINPQGEVHNPLNGQARISSYDGLRELCDLMFPPVVRRGGGGGERARQFGRRRRVVE